MTAENGPALSSFQGGALRTLGLRADTAALERLYREVLAQPELCLTGLHARLSIRVSPTRVSRRINELEDAGLFCTHTSGGRRWVYAISNPGEHPNPWPPCRGPPRHHAHHHL